MTDAECVLCLETPPTDSVSRGRYVWEDENWRLWTVTAGSVPGYSYLNARRHIPHITDLDGPEAMTLGSVLARVTRVLR